MRKQLRGRAGKSCMLVVGTGISGKGAVHLLHLNEDPVLLLEQNKNNTEEEIRAKLHPEDREYPEVVIGELSPEQMDSLKAAVLSPAVPMDNPLVIALQERKIPLYSEVELAFCFEKGKVLAITGTNGKTTTTSLTAAIMKKHREHVFTVGNIGHSYAEEVLETSPESVCVAEISSFQLECIKDFHPVVSAVTNISPDHLDRHHTMENYISIKERISENQNKEEICVLNYEDPALRDFGEKRCSAKVVWFSSARRLWDGYFSDDDNIFRAENGKIYPLMKIREMHLVGICNVENVMTALAVAEAAGVPEETALQVIRDFPPVEHRIEFVAEINGVEYYNDSKATNPDAAMQGIRAMTRPTYLIAGGYDKNNSYEEWIRSFDGKVKELVLAGATADKIAAAAEKEGFASVRIFDSMEECFAYCSSHAQRGEAVLLSPACASWGMFPNYEVRGNVFKEMVGRLRY